MNKELLQQAEPVMYQERTDLSGPYSSFQGWTDWRECDKEQYEMIKDHPTIYYTAQSRALIVAPTAQPADVAQAGVTKSDLVYLYWSGYTSGHHDTVEGNYTDVTHHDSRSHHADIVDGLISDGTIAQPVPGASA